MDALLASADAALSALLQASDNSAADDSGAAADSGSAAAAAAAERVASLCAQYVALCDDQRHDGSDVGTNRTNGTNDANKRARGAPSEPPSEPPAPLLLNPCGALGLLPTDLQRLCFRLLPSRDLASLAAAHRLLGGPVRDAARATLARPRYSLLSNPARYRQRSSWPSMLAFAERVRGVVDAWGDASWAANDERTWIECPPQNDGPGFIRRARTPCEYVAAQPLLDRLNGDFLYAAANSSLQLASGSETGTLLAALRLDDVDVAAAALVVLVGERVSAGFDYARERRRILVEDIPLLMSYNPREGEIYSREDSPTFHLDVELELWGLFQLGYGDQYVYQCENTPANPHRVSPTTEALRVLHVCSHVWTCLSECGDSEGEGERAGSDDAAAAVVRRSGAIAVLIGVIEESLAFLEEDANMDIRMLRRSTLDPGRTTTHTLHRKTPTAVVGLAGKTAHARSWLKSTCTCAGVC